MAGSTSVYLIQSMSNPTRHYVGRTADVAGRLASHNAGESPQTSKYRPWRLLVRIQCLDERRAEAFEKYLKSGSGRAFLEQHLLP
jgi:predicted GIY-YIG superfamily endonuclease